MGRISETMANKHFSSFVMRKIESLDATKDKESRLLILSEIDEALQAYNAYWSDLAFAAFEYPVMLKRINATRTFSHGRY